MPLIVDAYRMFYKSCISTASVVQWSEFLTANQEVLGSIVVAARFSE
jgi:hypothetical protein